LDVTKITKNKLVLSLKQVDAHHELLHTINLVKHDAEEKQICIETDFLAENFHIEADPSRLQQIFWNVVKNAVKFTPENGRIRITTRNDDMGLIRVEVKDTGIGIFTC
jgi:signal transduction histidine kinase